MRLAGYLGGFGRGDARFLSTSEIERIKAQVKDALEVTTSVICVYFDEKMAGFMICESERNSGSVYIAKTLWQGALVGYAINELGAKKVSVNEQNPRVFEFYKKFEFREVSRTATDGRGNPYPILHLELLGDNQI